MRQFRRSASNFLMRSANLSILLLMHQVCSLGATDGLGRCNFRKHGPVRLAGKAVPEQGDDNGSHTVVGSV